MKCGYARISTQDQDTQVQVAALKSAGCKLVFEEQASGGRSGIDLSYTVCLSNCASVIRW
nr:recombinase family protein [Candidatus Enterovibrio escacola]